MAYTTIDDPTIYFNTVLYTGNGGTQNITGVGFQTDFIWGKTRADNAGSGQTNHILTDVVRGAGKNLFSDRNVSERTNSARHSGFLSDGFSVGNDGQVNSNSSTYVAWNWKAGGSASSNSDGDITSSVSAGSTPGFSIIKYTGTGSNATVGHGLGSAPKMIIFKNTNSTRDWGVYHGDLGDPDNYLTLNQTYAKTTGYNFSNDTAPTSFVFSVGTLTNNNGSSQEYIAYCFAEKKGYSKFGSYTGNGNANGPFIYTGFKPAFFLVKNITNAGYDWELRDNKRDSYNPVGYRLEANTSDAESSYYAEYDFVSNGIKIKQNGNNYNTSGASYIYMAFAESPFVNSNGVPTNSR